MPEIKIVTMCAKLNHLNTVFLNRTQSIKGQGTTLNHWMVDVHAYHNGHHRQGIAQLADIYRPSSLANYS